MARNVGTTLIAQLLSWAVTLVVTVYVPRYLGPSGMGKLAYAGSYAATFAIVMGVVNGTVLVREIARDHSRLSELVSNAILLRIPLGVIVCVAGVWFAHVFAGPMKYTHELQELFWIGLAICVFATANDILSSALRGLEEIPRQNAAQFTEKVVGSVAMLYLVWRREPLVYIMATGFVSSAASFVIYASGIKPYFKGFVRPRWESSKWLVVASLPFVSTYLFTNVYGQCDPLLLGRMSDMTNLGWYALAKRLGGTTLFVPVALSSAMLPTLSRLYHEDKQLFDNVVRRFIGYMFLLVVPFASVLIFAPGPLLRLMHMPSSFNGAIPVVMILGFSIILWYLTQAAAMALVASDCQKVLSRATAIAAAMTIPCCVACIWFAQRKFGNGAVGAIVSDTAVELYLAYVYLRALPSGCVSGKQAGVLLKGAIAAIPMVVPLYLVHSSSRWAVLVALPGLIMFLPICYLLRCLGREDIDLVKTALGRKMGLSTDEAMELAIARGAEVPLGDDVAIAVSGESQEQIAAVLEAHG